MDGKTNNLHNDVIYQEEWNLPLDSVPDCGGNLFIVVDKTHTTLDKLKSVLMKKVRVPHRVGGRFVSQSQGHV